MNKSASAPKGAFVQTVEVKSWTGTIKVDLDDDVNALALFAIAPTLFELARYINGCLTESGECVIKLGQPMDKLVTELVRKVEGA